MVKSFASFAIQIGKTKDKMNAKLEKANGGSDDATASAGDGGEVDLTNPTSGDIPGLDDGVETSGTEPVQAGDAADIPTTGEQENSSANTDDDTVIPPAV